MRNTPCARKTVNRRLFTTTPINRFFSWIKAFQYGWYYLWNMGFCDRTAAKWEEHVLLSHLDPDSNYHDNTYRLQNQGKSLNSTQKDAFFYRESGNRFFSGEFTFCSYWPAAESFRWDHCLTSHLSEEGKTKLSQCGLLPFLSFPWQMLITEKSTIQIQGVWHLRVSLKLLHLFVRCTSSMPELSEHALQELMGLPSVLQALGTEKPSGIHVFAVLLHAHLAGKGIRLRHFRNGEEMQLLAYDDDYDFNFQEFQYLTEEQTILPVCICVLLQGLSWGLAPKMQ